MVVLVTGSSKGIGYQIASDLLDQGHDLILHCNRNQSSLEDLLSGYKSNSVIIQADKSSKTGFLVETMDQVRLAGVQNVSIAAEQD